ncbi:LpxL/LpxP family acyltransferase [Chitinimonas lacunae]|uniref:Acyltransferase n=1 Tax=Chitinimonas lacunae TaxID=1963018 RepID=A0ABV8MTY7_9NEIS
MNRVRTHWAGMGEHTFVFGIWLLYWVHRLCGRRLFRLCMYPVALSHWLLRPGLRAASLQYLSRLEAATGALGHRPDWRDGVRHVALFAETMLDKLLAVSGRYHGPVRSIGSEPVYQAALAGQGGVIVTAHLGCLELCRALAERRSGFRLNVLVHTRHAERFNRLLRRFGADAGVRLLEVTEISPATAVLLADKVAAGEYVAIAGDRVPVFASQTVEAEFLGHRAPFPVGPYVLASLLRCPLYLLGCIHEGRGYALHFEQLAEQVVLPRGRREAAMAEYAGRFARALTGLVARSPYDWFNFFPFWDQPHVKASS